MQCTLFLTSLHECGTFANINILQLTKDHSLHFTCSLHYSSIGFDKCITLYIHDYDGVQNSSTVLKIPFVPLRHLFPPQPPIH